jgi:xylulokinase
MKLVAGVDSSTQSCKVLICDLETGQIIRSGIASHPDATEVDPARWLAALEEAIAKAGGIEDVVGISIAGQQHGMVLLDENGEVLRPALLWNDTRSAQSALDLITEVGAQQGIDGAIAWANLMGSVPVASFTVTKLRWVADHEPEIMKRAAAVCLPHDWLSWKLTGSNDVLAITTDRSDASGTGYFSSETNSYLTEILELAAGRKLITPKVIPNFEAAAQTSKAIPIASGMGDNAAAAFGLNATIGEGIISLGTSGVVSVVSGSSTKDPTGLVAGFADGTGNHLPLACTLNGARVLDSTGKLLGISHQQLSEAALDAPRGSNGLTMLPYFEGERTPNLPNATGSLYGLTGSNFTSSNIARATVEGLLCSLADALDAIIEAGAKVDSLKLVGGAARSKAIQHIAPEIFGLDVELPDPNEYVALGAARQAAAMVTGVAPEWKIRGTTLKSSGADIETRARYQRAKNSFISN